MQLLGTHHIRTTAYHPSANVLVEQFHCQLKGTMKCLLDTTHWTKALPLILLGIRTSINKDSQCTVAELVYGTTLRLPGEFFHTSSTSRSTVLCLTAKDNDAESATTCSPQTHTTDPFTFTQIYLHALLSL